MTVRKTTNKGTKQPKIGKDKTCGMCDVPKDLSNYYKTKNPRFKVGYLPYCMDCLNDIDTDDMEAVLTNLRLLDKPFISKTWEKVTKTVESSNRRTFGAYITPFGSLPALSSKTFKDSEFSSNKEILPKNQDQPASLTPIEEKKYSVKWMGEYTNSDTDYMEEYYLGLDRDFKIATTSHKDYARKICKASLHMDKCFQDVLSGAAGADAKYKSARETFDTLSKSAQFSESQRGQNDVGLGAFGVVFDQVEQNKWIPKHIPMDEDAIDKMIKQFATIKDSV